MKYTISSVGSFLTADRHGERVPSTDFFASNHTAVPFRKEKNTLLALHIKLEIEIIAEDYPCRTSRAISSSRKRPTNRFSTNLYNFWSVGLVSLRKMSCTRRQRTRQTMKGMANGQSVGSLVGSYDNTYSIFNKTRHTQLPTQRLPNLNRGLYKCC